MQTYLNIIPPCINDADNASLLQPVTLEEVHTALHQIGPLKAPGPHGIHASGGRRTYT